MLRMIVIPLKLHSTISWDKKRYHYKLNHRPIKLTDNKLTFKDNGEVFQCTGDLIRIVTNRNYDNEAPDEFGEKYIFFWISEF